MAPQVEHSEETQSDETQPRPEKSRCVYAYLCACTDARVCLGAGIRTHARMCMLAWQRSQVLCVPRETFGSG